MQPAPAAVLFDLGNTLAAYYRPDEFGPILERCVANVLELLRAAGTETVPQELALSRALEENKEAPDFRFSPMLDRVVRVFGLSVDVADRLGASVCEAFLAPIFAVGCVYDDVPRTLRRLRAAGVATAIVSNAPWGSPPDLWRKELQRLGLAGLVDEVVLCGDVGWRKPARQIFEHAAARLGVPCDRCVFVGDDPEWDVAGSAAAAMRPVLIDRLGRHPAYDGWRITGLDELTFDGSSKRKQS